MECAHLWAGHPVHALGCRRCWWRFSRVVLKSSDLLLPPCLATGMCLKHCNLLHIQSFIWRSLHVWESQCRGAPAWGPCSTVSNSRCRLTSTADSPVNMSTCRQLTDDGRNKSPVPEADCKTMLIKSACCWLLT